MPRRHVDEQHRTAAAAAHGRSHGALVEQGHRAWCGHDDVGVAEGHGQRLGGNDRRGLRGPVRGGSCADEGEAPEAGLGKSGHRGGHKPVIAHGEHLPPVKVVEHAPRQLGHGRAERIGRFRAVCRGQSGRKGAGRIAERLEPRPEGAPRPSRGNPSTPGRGHILISGRKLVDGGHRGEQVGRRIGALGKVAVGGQIRPRIRRTAEQPQDEIVGIHAVLHDGVHLEALPRRQHERLSHAPVPGKRRQHGAQGRQRRDGLVENQHGGRHGNNGGQIGIHAGLHRSQQLHRQIPGDKAHRRRAEAQKDQIPQVHRVREPLQPQAAVEEKQRRDHPQNPPAEGPPGGHDGVPAPGADLPGQDHVTGPDHRRQQGQQVPRRIQLQLGAAEADEGDSRHGHHKAQVEAAAGPLLLQKQVGQHRREEGDDRQDDPHVGRQGIGQGDVLQ